MGEQARGTDVQSLLVTNGLAAGWSIFAAMACMWTVGIVGLGIVSGLVPLAIVMAISSVALSAIQAKTGRLSPQVTWMLALALSWGLSAPVGTWIWNAQTKADSSITLTGPLEFLPFIWLWALIPAAIYLAVGLLRFKRTTPET